MHIPSPTRLLKDKLDAIWAQRIAEELNPEILLWYADSACGIETLQIARLADFVAAEWPDAREGVIAAALIQIGVVCFG